MDSLNATELQAVAMISAQLDRDVNAEQIHQLADELAEGDPLDVIAAFAGISVRLLDALALSLQTPREQLWQQYARSTAHGLSKEDPNG